MNLPLATCHFESADSWLGHEHFSTRASRGFTVIELLVTMAIFSVLTGVVLARYRDYTTNASFTNASEDIILALRQAQVYGAGGKQNDAACAGGKYMCHYGVSFVEGDSFFTMFVDRNDNMVFDAGDTVLEKAYFESPITIADVSCDGSFCTSNNLGIVFIRPYTDAWINASPYNGIGVTPSFYFGTITITNGEKSSMVTISRAGQISIEQI
ncbi:MAG: type II secretion system protein [Patescibacteria group bacterium]